MLIVQAQHNLHDEGVNDRFWCDQKWTLLTRNVTMSPYSFRPARADNRRQMQNILTLCRIIVEDTTMPYMAHYKHSEQLVVHEDLHGKTE